MSGSSSIFDSMYSSYRTSAPSSAYHRSYVDYDTLSSGYSSSGSRIGSGNSGGGGGYSSISTTRGRTNRFMDSDYRSAYSSTNCSRSGTASSSSRYYANAPSYMDDVTSRFSGISTNSAALSYRPRHLNLSDMAGVSAVDLGGDNSTSTRNHSTSYRNSVLIDTAPMYDRYGKQMSNYDKWKQARGEGSGGGGYDVLSPRSETSGYSGISASSNSGYNDSNANIGGGGSSTSTYTTTIKENGLEPEVRKSRFSSRFLRNNNKSSNNNNSSTEDETEELRIVSKPLSPLKDDDFAPFSAGGRFNNSSSNFGVSKRSASVMPSTRFSSSSSSSSSFFPSGVREKLSRYNVRDVKGDGGCYYRCLSLYFSGSETNYMTYRREVMDYIRQHLDNYSTMIRSEIGIGSSTNDYFSRKTRADRQDWAETTEIIATCVVYNINVHVLALVPGKRIWEWLHFDPSIGTGKPSTATEDVYLYNQGSVHFQLCTPK